jgi:hypothetical protein
VSILIAGRFLLVGFLAWTAAIVLGVGSRFDLWSWRAKWPLAGALGGLGTFGWFVHADWVSLSLANALNGSLLALTAGLFVGCGTAVTYGTLFQRTDSVRPALESGSVEERLWILDALDRVRPQRLDWGLTGLLLVPGLGLIWLGLGELASPVPMVFGAASLVGPLYAGVGLRLRSREARRLLAELDERDAVREGDARQLEVNA